MSDLGGQLELFDHTIVVVQGQSVRQSASDFYNC
jgi:hypothetical protein